MTGKERRKNQVGVRSFRPEELFTVECIVRSISSSHKFVGRETHIATDKRSLFWLTDSVSLVFDGACVLGRHHAGRSNATDA